MAGTAGGGTADRGAWQRHRRGEMGRQIEEKRLQALAKRQEKAAAAAAAAAVAAPPLTNAVAPASKAGVGYDGLEKRTMGPSWYRVLQPEFSKAYFVKVPSRPARAPLLALSPTPARPPGPPASAGRTLASCTSFWRASVLQTGRSSRPVRLACAGRWLECGPRGLTQRRGPAAVDPVSATADDIYSWSQMCSFDQVRVVILGQDPYHDDNQAHGCAFSVRRGVAVPPSLANIYKELESCVPGFTRPRHGYLKSWCTQGWRLLPGPGLPPRNTGPHPRPIVESHRRVRARVNGGQASCC